MTLPLFRRPLAHFLHLGKTGGTAVKAALAPYPRVHCHPHEVRLADIPVGDKVFFFVRDPVERFVSGFLSRKRKGRPRYDVEWSAAEAEAFLAFDTPEDLARSLPDPAAVKAMASIGHVKDSYWQWFGDEKQLAARESDILFVGFTETLERDFARLRSLLGLPETVRLPSDPVLAHRSPAGRPRDLSDEARGALRKWYADDYAFLEWARGWQARAR